MNRKNWSSSSVHWAEVHTPTLGSWPERPAATIQPLSQRSAWVLIGALWIATVLVTSGVIFAIATFVG